THRVELAAIPSLSACLAQLQRTLDTLRSLGDLVLIHESRRQVAEGAHLMLNSACLLGLSEKPPMAPLTVDQIAICCEPPTALPQGCPCKVPKPIRNSDLLGFSEVWVCGGDIAAHLLSRSEANQDRTYMSMSTD